MGKITPVILCGGTGSRLWPLSRDSWPKQFLALTAKETLLQRTAARVSDRTLFTDLIVVANAEHGFVIGDQLRAIGIETPQIVLEPLRRNTAPAAAVAALIAVQDDPEAILLLMPADHDIDDPVSFRRALEAGFQEARNGSFVLFGIEPTVPATGYGYIRIGDPVREGAEARRVSAFVEKPGRALAESWIESGSWAWNSGIFVLPAQRLLDELSRLDPKTLEACKQALAAAKVDLRFLRLDPDAFSEAQDVSVDCAIMEKTTNTVVVPSSFAWSDIGTWSTLWEMHDKGEAGTVLLGNAVARETRDCYIRSEGPLVAALGVEGLVVVATQDAVLVTPKERDQDVKPLVEQMSTERRDAAIQARHTHGSWGRCQRIHQGERFQVRHVTVHPGAERPLQRHTRQAEHWIVISGTALVTRDGERIFLRENEAAYLPPGCTCGLENPGGIPLDLIEVQSGADPREGDTPRIRDA